MIPCEIHGFDEAGSVYVVLLTADRSMRIKKGQFRVMSAYDLIKLAGSVYDNEGRKQYIVDTSHRSSLLPYDEATVIDAHGGELHIQDREDASTTGESSDESESESESERESERDRESESDKWSERDSDSDSDSETHNESYEDPAEVSEKQTLKHAYRVLGLTFTDSSPTEQERKLVKKAYFDLMRKHHTDKPGGDNERAKAINGAKETIERLRFPNYFFGKPRVSRAS
jgi:Mg-chelatase subunit ChlI